MSWANGSNLMHGSPTAHARYRRLALIRRAHHARLRREAAIERSRMEGAIEDLDGSLDD